MTKTQISILMGVLLTSSFSAGFFTGMSLTPSPEVPVVATDAEGKTAEESAETDPSAVTSDVGVAEGAEEPTQSETSASAAASEEPKIERPAASFAPAFRVWPAVPPDSAADPTPESAVSSTQPSSQPPVTSSKDAEEPYGAAAAAAVVTGMRNPPPSSGASYGVAVAVFKNEANASSLERKLLEMGYPVKVYADGEWRSVVVGNFAERSQAEGQEDRLREKMGISGEVVLIMEKNPPAP